MADTIKVQVRNAGDQYEVEVPQGTTVKFLKDNGNVTGLVFHNGRVASDDTVLEPNDDGYASVEGVPVQGKQG